MFTSVDFGKLFKVVLLFVISYYTFFTIKNAEISNATGVVMKKTILIMHKYCQCQSYIHKHLSVWRLFVLNTKHLFYSWYLQLMEKLCKFQIKKSTQTSRKHNPT